MNRKANGRRKVLPIILLTVAILLLAAVCAAAWIGGGYAVRISRQSLEQARAWQEAHYDLSWYDAAEKTDYTVESYDGYVLHVQLIRNEAPSEKYVVISHGYTDNRYGALKYAPMYRALGYNLIVYDLRGHGLNEETFCTYSVREGHDLAVLLGDCRERYPSLVRLGIHGESLGAATTIACLQYRPEIDFAVADCPFSNIKDVLKVGLSSGHIPGFLVDLASVGAKVRTGFSLGEMRPIDCLAGNTVPVMFVHGGGDTFILPSHSEALQNADPGYSELHIIPGAAHAMSVLDDPEGYAAYLRAFLEKVESGRIVH